MLRTLDGLQRMDVEELRAFWLEEFLGRIQRYLSVGRAVTVEMGSEDGR